MRAESVMDPVAWERALCRLGHGDGVTLESVNELRAQLSPEGFGREMLMLWDLEPNTQSPGDIDPRQWAILAEQRDENDDYPEIAGRLSVGFATSKDGRWSTFGVAGPRPGLIQLEVEYRRTGDWWVGSVGKELSDKYGPIHVRSTGPSAALISTLREAGATVEEVPGTKYARATGLMLRKVSPTSIKRSTPAQSVGTSYDTGLRPAPGAFKSPERPSRTP